MRYVYVVYYGAVVGVAALLGIALEQGPKPWNYVVAGAVGLALGVGSVLALPRALAAYHRAAAAYYGWRVHREAERFRAWARSRGDHTPYTDESIVEGFRALREGNDGTDRNSQS